MIYSLPLDPDIIPGTYHSSISSEAKRSERNCVMITLVYSKFWADCAQIKVWVLFVELGAIQKGYQTFLALLEECDAFQGISHTYRR